MSYAVWTEGTDLTVFRPGETPPPLAQTLGGRIHVWRSSDEPPLTITRVPRVADEVGRIIYCGPWPGPSVDDSYQIGERYLRGTNHRTLDGVDRYSAEDVFKKPNGAEPIICSWPMLGLGSPNPMPAGTYKFFFRDVSQVNGSMGVPYVSGTHTLTAPVNLFTWFYKPEGPPRQVAFWYEMPSGKASCIRGFAVNPGGAEINPPFRYIVSWNNTHDIQYAGSLEPYTVAVVPAQPVSLARPLEPRAYPLLPAQDIADVTLMPVGDGWWSTDAGITAKAKELNQRQQTGETFAQLRDRLVLRVRALSHAKIRDQLYWRNIVPMRQQSVNKLTMSYHGSALTMANSVGYFWGTFAEARIPRLIPMDGPRGVGSIAGPTHLQVSHTGGGIFTENWRMGRWFTDGSIMTHAGLVHDNIPGQFQSVPPKLAAAYTSACKYGKYDLAAEVYQEQCHRMRLKLVGDFSGCAPFFRGFHLCWSRVDDTETLKLDLTGPQIDFPPFGMIPKHLRNPISYIPCSFPAAEGYPEIPGAVFMIEGNKDDPAAPRKITTVLEGTRYAFGVAIHQPTRVAYLTERNAGTISRYDIQIDGKWKFKDIWILCAMPEDCWIIGDWYYYTTRNDIRDCQIRRKHIINQRDQLVVAIAGDLKLKFIKGAGSHGGLVPKHSVGFLTWQPAYEGFPNLFLPQGDDPDDPLGNPTWTQLIWRLKLQGGPNGGRCLTGCGNDAGYGSALAFGPPDFAFTGQTPQEPGFPIMVFGGAFEGLGQISVALPTDEVVNPALFKAGEQEFVADGSRLLYGQHNYPLHHRSPAQPDGRPARDYYLANCKN